MPSIPSLEAVSGPAQVLWPGSEVWEDDAALRAWLRERVWTYHHSVGTCQIGPDPDADAVVDPSGHVHGLEALVDASVMPDIPSANTNLPTIMVAERLTTVLAS